MIDPNKTLESFAATDARIKEYRDKIEQLETDKANYHDKWLNALERAKDAEKENARLREGIQLLLEVVRPYTSNISPGWLTAELTKLLAKPEGAK